MSWKIILKEISFKIRDYNAINKKAKKIWNDGGRKERLSVIIDRLLVEKYGEDAVKIGEVFGSEDGMSALPLPNLLSYTKEDERLNQWERYKDKLERRQNKRREAETITENNSPPPPKSGNKPKVGSLGTFKNEFPKSAILFREWVDSTSFRNLNELLGLVGSPTIGNKETIGRLRKFIKEQELNEEDKTALTAIADQMVKETNVKIRTNRRLSGNVIQSKALGLTIGKNSKMYKTQLSIKYGQDKILALKGKNKNFLDEFERLDLTSDRYYNETNTKEIFEYWVKETGFTGSAEKFIKLDPLDKSKYIKPILRSIPEYPKNVKITGLVYKSVFKYEEGGYVINEENAPEEFAYFLQGMRDGMVGGKGARTAYDFNTLLKFNRSILPNLIDAIKLGVSVKGGVRDRRLGPPISKLMNRLSKDQEDKKEIITVIGDIIRGTNISDKYQGSDKDTLAKIETDIREQLKQKIAGKTVASYLLSTFMNLYKSAGILSSILNAKTLIPVEYLTPQESPKTKTSDRKTGVQVLQRGPYEDTKKSLDNLLVFIGEGDEIIIKEDVGLILESLNKKQKQKVKAILNIADPTEYFGHDFLKLSELIRLLKTLGVVKGDKKLNKKILRYDEENVKVIKLAARLRKDYERLYNDLREMIYPKSGEQK